jgi:rare lipoprotein A
MGACIRAILLVLMGLIAFQAAAAQPVAPERGPVIQVSTRGFDWFFANSRPEGKCAGEFVVATWYQSGRRTASGQPFNPNGFTAAHRTLPFGTQLTVTNPRSGKSVTVVINDRGPFTRGVTLDLARGAARAIGMTQTQWVCLSAINPKRE